MAKEGSKIGMLKLPDFHEYVKDLDYADSWCLVWSQSLIDIQEFSFGGEDLFIRLAHPEQVGGQASKTIIISVSSVSSIATLSLVIFIDWHRWRTSQKRKSKTVMDFDFIQTRSYQSRSPNKFSEQHDPSELLTFALDNILVATN
ncbi:G-type lectin S-receptor-like serine/threonine-protein kinase At1g61490 [Morus notabilis]|uniref:G-type lectin S-receptor-like serine/threonine-protein kinase At1g61490 n=1 Tax=Morus notabilis TaxID=981085 RepID=UPI000CED5DAF|nr:G-type lectin S-receptor-like serine/threonine-protein kinase At1g61490 [Morus notabilis]